MNLTKLFPNHSQSFREANPAISGQFAKQKPVQPIVARRRGIMNRNEKEFSLILEAMKRKGEILRWEFEGITLRFAGVRYTPDFVVFKEKPTPQSGYYRIKFIEVKGPYTKGKFERAIERFRHARTYWDCFSFELWQKQKGGWERIS